MRRFAWLLVIAILGIVFMVGNAYLRAKIEAKRNAPALPAALARGLSAKASKWEWANNQGDKPKALIRASSFREIKDPPSTELEGLELLLYDQSGTKYDLVESASARFTKGDRVLFSESDVRITMGIPEGGPKPNRVLEIKSSGVRFELDSNKASTEKPVWFKFGLGEGKAIGADYDPNLHELNLRSSVELTWHGAKTMRVEAGEALYKELESRVYLKPWAKLTRDTLVLNAQSSVVELDKGIVRRVDAEHAIGTDKQKGRTLEYGADGLHIDFNEKGQAQKVEGTGTAHLASSNERERTLMNAARVQLDFVATDKESTLDKAFAQGKARVESKPVPREKVLPAETKVLSSESIEMKMRAGGEEIERMETHDPGVIELLPNQPTQRQRRLDGERIQMAYGKNNVLEKLTSVKSTTRTEPAASPVPKTPGVPVLTSSLHLEASFTPTGELARMEQWVNFRYQEGTRQATAEKATMEQAKSEINLTGKARVWDPSGSTEADAILLDQKSGDFTAKGQVRSVREGERKAAATGLMSGSDPVRATANEMYSTGKNTQVRYEGRAVMWQGANRLSANRIDIDRPAQILKAKGQVVSQLLDTSTAKSAGQVFTLVRAPELLYSDKDQFAHYTGGSVLLTRPGLQVKGQEIRAYLTANENSQSNWEGPNGGLEKAFADGKVEILETKDTKSRQGWGDHAEYYVGESRLVLEGTRPKMVDLLAGVPQRTTEGKSLVWFANNDRLIVDGEENKRAISNLKKK